MIGRDHLDCGSVASPYRETEAMARRLRRDRRLAAAERAGQRRRPGRPGCRSTTAAGSASAARSTPARSASPTAPRWPAEKLDRVLTNDPGMGVIRHVDAGYDRAVEVAAERGVRIPMREGRERRSARQVPAPVRPRGLVRAAFDDAGPSWHRSGGDQARRLPPVRLDAARTPTCGSGSPARPRPAASTWSPTGTATCGPGGATRTRRRGRRRRHRQPPGLGAGRRRLRRPARRRLAPSRRSTSCCAAGVSPRPGRSPWRASATRRAPGSGCACAGSRLLTGRWTPTGPGR